MLMNTQDALRELADVHSLLRDALSSFESDFGSDVPLAGMGRVGSALAEHLEEIGVEPRQNLFDLVEALLACGDERIETAVATGFLDGFVSASVHRGLDRQASYSYFGPLARKYVVEWDEFFGIEPPVSGSECSQALTVEGPES